MKTWSVKRKLLFIGLPALVVIAATILIIVINSPRPLFSHIVMGCSATQYEQHENIGYLTIEFENKNNMIGREATAIKVSDKELQNTLSSTDVSKIIGVNLFMEIPPEKAQRMSLHVNTSELFRTSNMYDEYTVLTGISVE